MSTTGLYGFDGEPIDFWEWMRLFHEEDRHVAVTAVDEDVYVSTVWLGIDYALLEPPAIFETMIFGGRHDHRMWRYANRDAALAGHDQAVALAREAVSLES